MTAIEKALETPMMKQYMAFKELYPDAILFFRLGDFYEMFFEDAITASEILGITLTSRHKDAEIPLAGIPWHSADQYIRKLLEAGKKVAICEQTEKPDKKKKTVERDVVRILTPGTVVEESSLAEEKSNWLMSLAFSGLNAGVSWIDISCGEIYYSESQESGLDEIIRSIAPKEIVLFQPSGIFDGEAIDPDEFNDWVPSLIAADYLEKLDKLTLSQVVLKSLRTMLFYVDKLYFGNIPPLRLPEEWKNDDTAALDYNTALNLEIEKTLIGGMKQGSFLWAIDRTQTPMGKRILANTIKNPLKNRNMILNRQSCVETLVANSSLFREIREKLARIRDFERTLGRILVKRGGPREIQLLADSLITALELRDTVLKNDGLQFFKGSENIKISKEILQNIRSRFIDEPPFNFKEGGFIVHNYSEKLFELSDLINNSRKHIAALEQKEKNTTEISTLKVGFNRVFGYYFEISKRFADKVPSHYIRKQTTANSERYFTADLKELEEKILTAKDKLTELELEILEQTVIEIAENKDDILFLAKFISRLDLFAGFAKLALDNDYCKPEIVEEEGIEIIDGRHPVVEASVPKGSYVPASVSIGNSTTRFNVITGPNMGGKSTLMRMVALTVLMAQTGSFVPAKSARIGIVDSIFTRVGASDNLSKGESTFLVEMKETAAILNRATAKSLIILDEIGRGTGTYDGISLARAIAEYIIKRINATTLFATHYHILTELSEDFSSVSNFHMTVREYGGRIRFSYQLKEGGSSRSFGVEVARLTDMPSEVIKNAEKLLKDMEKTDRKFRFERGSSMQTDIFSMASAVQSSIPEYFYDVERVIKRIDPDRLTPRDAMNIIFQIFDIVNGKKENSNG
ncbi:MAG TPA: DNA mismatch repair protein MutS [bacterium]|nr:DNA mismatch repair protein MutS [bacterium]